MWNSRNSCVLILAAVASHCFGLDLHALPEFSRPDPFGGIVPADRPGAIWLDAVKLTAARDGYRSFHLVAKTDGAVDCRLSIAFPLTTDLYREWFHFNLPDRNYYPDALIPVQSPYNLPVSDAQNRIADQTSQAFWVDIWIPPATEPKVYRGQIRLTSGSQQKVVPLELTVLPAIIPAQDAVTLDNNSYGTSWLSDQYPETLASLGNSPAGEENLIRLIHDHHRIFYDHRGTFHQLGYGHAGKVGPEFAPELSGDGRLRHVSNWDRFDRHYGPLFDGTAFKDSRRGPRPIPYVYLPVNPEWPASFLWWGESGYEAEFENVLADMERHFRAKHWTSTKFEIFFNHKKRYKGFNWDGDEIRFARDNSYLTAYHQMLEKAIPADSPIHFAMRADSSWSFEDQSNSLYGIVTMWVVGAGELSWYPDAVRHLKAHGDTLWTYGGTPAVQDVSTSVTLNPLRSWITGVNGFVRWQTVDPGPDPWYALTGGTETLVYPGERFGIAGPVPSIRLKLQRNCLQDLALLETAASAGSRDAIREQVVRRFNDTTLSDWRNTRPPLASKPVLEWNNTDITEALQPFEDRFSHLQPASWERVRQFALELQQ
jgi:Domain of unknown function (DUF4091)